MFSIGAFLVGVGTITAIAGGLALLIAIADATIANYGELNISINGGARKLTVKGGRPLLGTLMEEGIFIPSACGGRGSCGLCRIRVTAGAGDYAPTELPWIAEADRKRQVRLSCQLKVKRDMAIEIPEALFAIREYETEVASIRDLTYDIRELSLKLRNPGEISFKAGQYIQLEVPEYELSREPIYRAYSISSSPSQSDIVELEIRLVPNGICTTYIFKYLKVGDKLHLNGPYGEFFLRDTDRDIVFIAGGSGMAPIKAILLDMAEKGSPRKADYFFGAQTRQDLFLVEEMRELEKRLANFRFIPSLRKPLPEDGWQGEIGLVTEVVERNLMEGKDLEAYLCGSPGMIDACIKVLLAKGVPADRIYYDKFA